MRKTTFLFYLAIAFLIFSGYSVSYPQIALQGGRGLMRVQDAETVSKGDLYLGGFGSTYLKKSDGSLAKDYHFTLNVTYGFSSVLEFSSRLVLYQDDQRHIWGPIGDTELGLKFRIPISSRLFNLALRNYFVLPTAPIHNVAYEPLSWDHVTWSPGVLASLDFVDAFYIPFKLYANVGLLDRYFRIHNIFGESIDQYYLGAGIKLSVRNTILFWEYYTEQFLNQKSVPFSANYQIATQGIAFVGPYNLIATIAGEINLANTEEQKRYLGKKLADWKVWIGLTKYFSFRRYLSELAERRRQQRARMKELKKQQEIKKERISAQEELRRMQERLKKKKKKKEDQP